MINLTLIEELNPDFIAIDVETANSNYASICQIGLAFFKDGEVCHSFETLVNPEDRFSHTNMKIHGITPEMVLNAPIFSQIIKSIRPILDGRIVIHHTAFDQIAIKRAAAKYYEYPPNCFWLDSSMVARNTWADCSRSGFGLADLAKKLNYEFSHHDALEDAIVAGKILVHAISNSGKDLSEWAGVPKEPKKKKLWFDEEFIIEHTVNIISAHQTDQLFMLPVESYIDIKEKIGTKRKELVDVFLRPGLEMAFEMDKYDRWALHAHIFQGENKGFVFGDLSRLLAGKLVPFIGKGFIATGHIKNIPVNPKGIPDRIIPIELKIFKP